MKICFVLPRYSRSAIGGYKIIFEYANRLVKKEGYEISILFLNEDTFVEHKIPEKIKPVASSIMTMIEPRWFELDRNIKKISGTNYRRKTLLKEVDVCVATGIQTVESCEKLFPNAKKIYFIQGYETWAASEKEVKATYNKDFINIVISNWLKNIVDKETEKKSILIKNPIDLNVYRPLIPIEERFSHSIGLLYHSNEDKGLRYSFEALKILKEKYSDLKVYMFGTSEPTIEIPGLVKFIKNASLQDTIEIYNSVSIFMCSSIKEGYGLTGMEAMACGAALVSSNYDAVYEYVKEGKNALLSPVRDVEKMVSNISYLFENQQERYKLAYNGVESLETFGWETAINKFIDVLEGRCESM